MLARPGGARQRQRIAASISDRPIAAAASVRDSVVLGRRRQPDQPR